jgi:outer membrane protein assembly factor BamE (lipoprotein component of BamABCDE complex)
MPTRFAARRMLPLALAIALGAAVAGCSMSGLELTRTRTQGYDISEDALAQIRPGQSQDLVVLVLGSPQTTNSFGDETAYYYIETTLNETAFGLSSIKERKVLAIYFDKNHRVSDKALYGAKDGKVFAIESRRTASFGEDRTFIQSIIASFIPGG